MLKTHGHRRLALLLALVFVTSLLAACSSSQSSTDEPLSHPGKDYIGTIRMDMDPNNETIEITKLNDAVSNDVLTKISGFSVSTSGVSFAGDRLTGNITFKWTGPERLEDASIRVFSVSNEGKLATIDNADTCKGLALDACIGGGGTEGIVYVGDEAADGPETEWECGSVYPTCLPQSPRGLRLMSPGCTASTLAGNSITAKWEMSESTAGHPKYSFLANVYGTKVTPVMKDDPRYDVNVASFHMKAYAPLSTGANPNVNTARPLTYVKTGQWFYVLSYVDAPGDKSRNQNTKLCDDGDSTMTCSTALNSLEQYDFYYIEDQANFDAQAAQLPGWRTPSSVGGSAYNTGFLFSGGAGWTFQYDPAVLKSNDCSGTATILGTGVKSFKTKGAVGTTMNSYQDTVPADQWGADTTVPWDNAHRVPTSYAPVYNYAGTPATYPPMPDWLDVDDYGTGITQGDYPSGVVAMKAIGPSGSGAPIRLSPSGNTVYIASIGNGSISPATTQDAITQKSANYPIWGYAVGVAEGPSGSIGHYNEQIAWICVQ